MVIQHFATGNSYVLGRSAIKSINVRFSTAMLFINLRTWEKGHQPGLSYSSSQRSWWLCSHPTTAAISMDPKQRCQGPNCTSCLWKTQTSSRKQLQKTARFHGLSFQLHVSICQHFTKSDPGPIHQVTSKLSGMHCIFPPNRGPRFVLDVSDLEAPGEN